MTMMMNLMMVLLLMVMTNDHQCGYVSAQTNAGSQQEADNVIHLAENAEAALEGAAETTIEGMDSVVAGRVEDIQAAAQVLLGDIQASIGELEEEEEVDGVDHSAAIAGLTNYMDELNKATADAVAALWLEEDEAVERIDMDTESEVADIEAAKDTQLEVLDGTNEDAPAEAPAEAAFGADEAPVWAPTTADDAADAAAAEAAAAEAANAAEQAGLEADALEAAASEAAAEAATAARDAAAEADAEAATAARDAAAEAATAARDAAEEAATAARDAAEEAAAALSPSNFGAGSIGNTYGPNTANSGSSGPGPLNVPPQPTSNGHGNPIGDDNNAVNRLRGSSSNGEGTSLRGSEEFEGEDPDAETNPEW